MEIQGFADGRFGPVRQYFAEILAAQPATAAAVAGFYHDLAAGGLLSPGMLAEAVAPQCAGPDRVLGGDTVPARGRIFHGNDYLSYGAETQMSETSTAGSGGGAAAQWRLTDRVALVTGASGGLGARFARVLHQAGAHVAVTARRADLLDQLARECGERIEVMPGDITDASHRQALAGRLAAHGRLDVLVNNAGICDDGPIEQQSLEELRRVIEVNLVSVLDLCRLTAPLLLAAPAASVINVASMYGIVASRGPMAAYNATKGALVNLTRQLAAQWGQRGVRVNALAPGYFPTELTGQLADAGFAQSIREHTLLARTPALEEIDGPLLFLATAASSYMTGQVLVIDGGWTAV